MSEQNRQIYTFGAFQLDVSQRLLFRAGQHVPLQPKLFETLLALVEKHDQLVSREELMQRIWPDTFVEEINLTKNISILRKILEEGDGHAGHIVTIPRRGYRFVAEVTVRSHEENNNSHPSIAEPIAVASFSDAVSVRRSAESFVRSGRIRHRRLFFSLAGVGIVILIMITALPVIRYLTRDALPHVVSIEKLPALGEPRRATISADGRLVAYCATEAGKIGLWLYDCEQKISHPLLEPGADNINGLCFSGDAKSVYFIRQQAGLRRRDLYQVGITDRSARLVLENVSSLIGLSPDGRQLAFVREDLANGTSAVWLAQADGTGERLLSQRTGAEFYPLDGPAWSPDGQMLVTPAGSTRPQVMYTIVGVRVADGKEIPLTAQQWENVRRAEWLADGSGLIVSAQLPGQSHRLWFVSRPDGQVSEITHDLNSYPWGAIPDRSGRMLATVQERWAFSILSIPADDLTHTDKVIPIANTQQGFDGVGLTADEHIIYSTLAGGRRELWVADPQGRSRQMEPECAGCQHQIMTRDGRYLIVSREAGDGTKIWRLDLAEKRWLQLTHGSLDMEPQLTPDEKWVIYSSEKSGKRAIWKVSIEGGQEVQIYNGTAESPAVSPDGRIACLVWENDTEAQVEIWSLAGGGPSRIVPEIKVPEFPKRKFFRWHPDGKSLTWIRIDNGVANLWKLNLESGRREQLTRFSSGYLGAFEWSADGQRLICVQGNRAADLLLLTTSRSEAIKWGVR